MSYEEIQAVIRIDCVIDFVTGLSERRPEDASSYEFIIQKLEEVKELLELD